MEQPKVQIHLGANGITQITLTYFWGNIFKIFFKSLQKILQNYLQFSLYYYVKVYVKKIKIYVILKKFEVYL
jgi:hypothetical protein